MKLKKRKGSTAFFLSALMGSMIIGLMGMSILDVYTSTFKNIEATGIGFEAQFLAVSKMNEINETPYYFLKSENKAEVLGTDFEREVLLGDEEILLERNKQRKVTVNIYKKSENVPRYTAVTFPTVRGTPFWEGMIMVFNGLESEVPPGWALCDGKKNTPDLRGRFVVMYGNYFSYKDKGGKLEHLHKTRPHALTVAELPKHDHTYNLAVPWPKASPFVGGFATVPIPGKDTGTAGGSMPHTHGDTSKTEHLPPYYALAYIMKIKE